MGRRRRTSHTLMAARRLIRGSAVNNINHKRAVDLAVNRTGGSCMRQTHDKSICNKPAQPPALVCCSPYDACARHGTSRVSILRLPPLWIAIVRFYFRVVSWKNNTRCATQFCPLASGITCSRDYSKCVWRLYYKAKLKMWRVLYWFVFRHAATIACNNIWTTNHSLEESKMLFIFR